ncbi:MAG: tRNA methyl transferase PRC-barrel domain-containing protein [Alistipes sp.]
MAAPYAYAKTDGTCVGRHRGAHFFTIGQRKGLNVGGKPEPLFVIATDVERNVLYVGQGQRHPGLYRRGLRILPDEMHWVRPDRALQPGASARFRMRIRYRQPLQDGVLHVTPEGGYIVFDEPQRGVTAGQFASWYDGEELIGSGVIHC